MYFLGRHQTEDLRVYADALEKSQGGLSERLTCIGHKRAPRPWRDLEEEIPFHVLTFLFWFGLMYDETDAPTLFCSVASSKDVYTLM